MQKSRHFAFAMAVALLALAAAPGPRPVISSTLNAPSVALTTSSSPPGREIFGFALASSLADTTVGYPSWNFDLLSTVAFFGLHVDPDGQFAADAGWNTWNSSALTSLVSLAHRHGTKVVLTVVLQDFSPNTPSMCAGLQHAGVTVAAAVTQVKAKAVDGVNIDYEGLDGSCGTADPYWAQHALTGFAQKMRAGLGPSYYLSIDSYASAASDGYGFFDVVGLASYVDSFFVMAYDLEYSNYSRAPESCPRFCLGPTSPLSAYYYNDSTVAAQFVAAVGASKVLLGIPYYGRKACVGAAIPNALPTSGVVADSYLDAAAEAADSAVAAGTYVAHRDAYSSGAERWDTWYNASLGCTRELYWDDVTSLSKKYDLVNSQKLRGVGVWNLNYGGGAPELWAALASHLDPCTGVTLAFTPAPPTVIGSNVMVSAAASGCTSPVYEFWLRAAGSTSWQLVRPYSASATYSWNTTGAASGSVYIGVWARDANSGAAYDANASTPVVLVSPCTSVKTYFSPAPPLAAGSGSAVTITAAASGCTSPLYEFWMRPASANAWQLVQAYSTSPTYRWNTTGAPAGTVYFGVWARDLKSGAAYDANGSVPFTLYSPCRSASTSFSPASPLASGTGKTVTVSASAATCPHPLYEFWMRSATSSTWQLVQGYSTSATYQWNTTGAPAGTVYFGVWTRDSASPESFDSNGSAPFVLFAPCKTATLSFSPASPIPHGSGAQVTITAGASGCPSPLYEFWMRPATSSTWQLLQAYSTSATYHWNTNGAPAGTVYFGVWVRDQQSAADYDVNASAGYGLS
jgi:spore germination protein YaaH